MPPIRLALASLAAVWALGGGGMTPAAAIATLAGVAAVTAARERRHRDMALAAGIMVGASAAGLALLPVLLGTAIARRVAGGLLPAFALAATGVAVLVGWSTVGDASLATIAPMESRLLLLAAASGVAAWLAASCAARSPSARELEAAALLAALALPLLAPLGIEATGLAFALALGGVRPTLAPIARAANDAPLPLRVAA